MRHLCQWVFMLGTAVLLCCATELDMNLPRNQTLISDFARNVNLTCRDVYNSTDQCAFVQNHCYEDITGFIDYFKLYFCGPPKLITFILMTIWVTLLFGTLGITASDFFSPNLATAAKSLYMSESLAGVTLLAFGNGSPDLFSTYSALKAGSASMALGELVGAAFFICTVVVGSMCVTRPFRVFKKPFLRDVVLFIIAVLFTIVMLFDGKLRAWEASLMIVSYFSYVFLVMAATYWWNNKRKRRRIELMARLHVAAPSEEQEISWELNDSDEEEGDIDVDDIANLNDGRNGVIEVDETVRDDVSGQAIEGGAEQPNNQMSLLHVQSRRGLRKSSLHGAIRPSLFGALEFRALRFKLANESHNRNQLSRPSQLFRSSSDLLPEIDSPSGKIQPPHPTLSAEPHDIEELRRTMAALSDQDYSSSTTPHHAQQPSSTSNENIPTHNSTPVLRITSPAGDFTEIAYIASPIDFRDPNDRKYHHMMNTINKSIQLGCDFLKLLFPTLRGFSQQSNYEKFLSIIAAPSVFVLVITLPVVEWEGEFDQPETDTSNDPEQQSLLNLRDATPLISKHKHWNRNLHFVQCICTPLFLVWVFTIEEGLQLKPFLWALLAGVIVLAILILCTTHTHPPPGYKYFCFIGFAISIVWISTIADEVVGALKAFGVILNVSEAIIGLTVFAIGNSLADLVANITIARMGYPVMALSACFGGPMFNILLGVGASGLVVISKNHADIDMPLSSSLIVSTVGLLVVLQLLLIAVPLSRWRMTKRLGYLLISIFVLCTIVGVVAEIWNQ